jgi:hypothetical protein
VRAQIKRASLLLYGPLLAVGLAACANTVSTASFKGEEHEVAQAISSLQADATAGDEQKLCANDLASAVVARLSTVSGGCKQAIKNQLTEVESLEVSIHSVDVTAKGTRGTASARVGSIYAGKTSLSTLSLVKEAGKWKVSGLQ